MPAIPCPSCGRQLKMPAEVLGKKVRCPACKAIFVAAEGGDSPGEPESPPPPTKKKEDAKALIDRDKKAVEAMSRRPAEESPSHEQTGITSARKKTPPTSLAPRSDPADDVDDGPARSRKSRHDNDDEDPRDSKKQSRRDDDDYEDDEPRSKKKSRDDDDDDDISIKKKSRYLDDDEDDAPRSKKTSRYDDDDDDDYDAPRSRKRSRSYDDDDEDDYDDEPTTSRGRRDKKRAQSYLMAPGICLIIFASLWLLLQIVNLAFAPFMARMNEMQAQRMNRFGGQRFAQNPDDIVAHYVGTTIGAVIGCSIAGLILAGGVAMLKMKYYPLALAGSIAALLPCNCCCCITIGLGIWALIVLCKPEVKRSFR